MTEHLHTSDVSTDVLSDLIVDGAGAAYIDTQDAEDTALAALEQHLLGTTTTAQDGAERGADGA